MLTEQFGFLFGGVGKHPVVCKHTKLSCEKHNERVSENIKILGLPEKKQIRREKHGSKAKNQNQA